MKRFQLSFALAFALLLCTSMFAQSYSFKTVLNPNEPTVGFTQLLGINNSGVIAGYHNFNQNQGFTLVLPNAVHHRELPQLGHDPGHRHQQQPDHGWFLCGQRRSHSWLFPHQ